MISSLSARIGQLWRNQALISAVVLCMLVVFLGGCGDKGLTGRDALLQTAQTDTVAFAAFCHNWGLACPEGTAPNFPDAHAAYTVQQWQALSAIGAAFLNGSGEVTITRDEIEADTLGHVVNELGLAKWYDQLVGRIKTLGWRDGGIGGGAVRASFDAPTVYTGKSGAQYSLADTLQIGVDPQAALKFSGMKVSSANGAESQAVETFSVTAANVGRLALDPLAVDGVPLAFLADETLGGIDLGGLKGANLDMQKMARAMRPLFDWINQPGRNVILGEDFFGVARQKVPQWISGETAQNVLYPMTAALTSLAMHLGSTDQELFSIGQLKTAKLVCDMTQGSQKITMKFDSSFGLKSYEPLDDDAVRLELFGIKATVSSAMGMTITLGRIDITPEKIVIYNVPIVGTYEMKLADMKKSDEKSSFVCKK